MVVILKPPVAKPIKRRPKAGPDDKRHKLPGGARPNAGRKAGSPSTRGKGAIQNFLENTVEKLIPMIGANYAHLEPKEIMLLAARLAAFEGRWGEAAVFAEKAAPYYNRRLAHLQIDQKVTHSLDEMSDSDLMGLIQMSSTEYSDVTAGQKEPINDDRFRIEQSSDIHLEIQRETSKSDVGASDPGNDEEGN